MATKFSSIYKQELKSRGALESLGSTVVKSMAERVDLRNVLFGGKGFVAKTGRRIFGKGYDSIDRARKITPDSSAAVAAVASLQESNKRQEDALKVIVKNTMNMNMMARDMNITRQNIASLTKAVTGKSSRGADALWMNAAKRDRGDTQPTKVGGSSSSIVSGVLGGMMGIGGSIGSGIFRALGSIIAISPILGIVGIAAAGYAIKKMGESIDFAGMFNTIKKNILDFLGVDPESDTPIIKQLAARLDGIFGTTKFTSIYDWVEKNFGPYFKQIGQAIEQGTKLTIAYTSAAFKVLGDNFGKLGEIFSFHFKDFINQYKPELLATLGASIGLSVGSLFGVGPGLLAGVVTGAVGYVLGRVGQNKTIPQLEEEIGKKRKELEQIRLPMVTLQGETLSPEEISNRELFDRTANEIDELERALATRRKIESSMTLSPQNFPNNFRPYLEEELKKQGLSSKSPEKVSSDEILDDDQKRMAKMIYDEFYREFKSPGIAMAAVANAYRESKLDPKATNLKNENSRGLFQVNLNDPNNFRYLSEKGFNEQNLLDPKTNIRAMIELMKSAPGNLEKLKMESTLEGITRNLSTNFLRPKGAEEEERIRIAHLSTAARLLEGSVELDNLKRTSGYASQTPIIQNISNNNVTKTAAPAQPIPNAFNVDVGELLFAQLVRGM
jgi:hypothetical protein